MVIGIFKARLQCIVVYISHAALGFNAVKPHGFKFKIRHGARSVLRQCLVDFKRNLAAHGHIARKHMRFNNFLCNSVAHNY